MRLKYYLYTILASVILLMTACSPDKDGLGGIDVTPEQLAAGKGFSIDVNQETNQVTFKSLMPSSYSVYWEYGPMPADGAEASISGTSTNSTYSLGIAFDGQYYVRMGVQTRGGIVFSERAPFSIDKMNVALLSDPLWTSLTGGVGSSKTWVLDIDASGTSVYFGGPKWFYTTGANWNNFHDAKGANYVDSKSWDASTAIEPSSDWYWGADWAGNQWICGAADYGTMTFNLDGGANVEVNGSNGAFNMDVDNHTITFTSKTTKNSIILKFAGYYDSSTQSQPTTGYYWTSTAHDANLPRANSTLFAGTSTTVTPKFNTNANRYTGLPVRPVYSK